MSDSRNHEWDARGGACPMSRPLPAWLRLNDGKVPAAPVTDEPFVLAMWLCMTRLDMVAAVSGDIYARRFAEIVIWGDSPPGHRAPYPHHGIELLRQIDSQNKRHEAAP
jgi:hypothetical protein